MGIKKYVLGVGPKAFEVQTWNGAVYKFEATVMRRPLLSHWRKAFRFSTPRGTRGLDHDNGGITVCIWEAGKPQEPEVLL